MSLRPQQSGLIWIVRGGDLSYDFGYRVMRLTLMRMVTIFHNGEDRLTAYADKALSVSRQEVV
jgi:hypothetical protein